MTSSALPPPLGIIEGYFGRPWSWADRAAVVQRLAPHGYRFFHYAPKVEAKLRRDWTLPFTTDELADLAGFSGVCRAAGVRLGIGLTPFEAHGNFDAAARAALAAKLAVLDMVGIDDLVILFDDMRGDFADLAERQADIVHFAADHSRADQLFTCPSYYSDDPVLDRVFGPRPANYLADLGRLLDPAVAVYWTGEEVCAREIKPGHLAAVSEQLRRRPALWDNYPVNDGPRMSRHLHLRAFTGRSAAIAPLVSHHAINPASQPVLGCIPALTLPRLYADGDAYCYGAALADAAAVIAGPDLGAALVSDLLQLQDAGLAGLDDAAKARLNARYQAFDHPAARELCDWLAGGYAITGEALRTQ